MNKDLLKQRYKKLGELIESNAPEQSIKLQLNGMLDLFNADPATDIDFDDLAELDMDADAETKVVITVTNADDPELKPITVATLNDLDEAVNNVDFDFFDLYGEQLPSHWNNLIIEVREVVSIEGDDFEDAIIFRKECKNIFTK